MAYAPLEAPSHPSYATASSASTLTRLAHLLAKDTRRTSADASLSAGTHSQGHSRSQSDDSDWYAARYNAPLAAATGRRGTSGLGQRLTARGGDSGGSSSDDRESTVRGRPEARPRGASASANHPYASASGSNSQGYSTYPRGAPQRSTPGTPGTPPTRAPTLRLQPPTPSQAPVDRTQHALHQQQTPQRRGPSFYALDADPGIGESPKPSPLKPSKSAAAVARFRAAAAKHDHARYGTEREERVVPFYSTDKAPSPRRAGATLPASTLSVITSTAALEAAGLPPTPPMQGDFGTATVYPPVRVSGAPPLSPPQEPTRLSGLSGQHPYASAGVTRSFAKEQELSPRRVRSHGSMLSAFEKPTTPPKSPNRAGFPSQIQQYAAPSFPSHPYAPVYAVPSSQRAPNTSATTALAATALPIPPLRVPQPQPPQQLQNSGHPFADPTFRRQRLDSGPEDPGNLYAQWTGRNRSQTNLDLSRPPPVPTHWRQQALRPSASAFDLRSPTSPRSAAVGVGLGIGHPSGPNAAGGWHLFPRLTSSKSHGRLKPSTSTFATSGGAGETHQSARTDTSYQSLQVRTACDALVFPRPRFRPHEISPPDSPNESPLFTPGEWARTQRQRNNLTETDPVPPQPRSAFLQRVLAEGEQRERERTEWAAAAERGQIFNRRRAKSMPRSRDRPRTNLPPSQSHYELGRPSSDSRGAISDSEDSHRHWWNKKKASGESYLTRNPSTGSRVLRKTSSASVSGQGQRPRTESMPAAVDPHARTTAVAVANGAMVARGDSLMRQRNTGAALNGFSNGQGPSNGHGQARRMEARNPRTVRTSDDLPLVDIRPGAAQPPVTEQPQQPAQPRPRPTAATRKEQPGQVSSAAPPVRVAASTSLIHPHIPHPYAAAFGAAAVSDLRSMSNGTRRNSRDKNGVQPPLSNAAMAGPHTVEAERMHHLGEEAVLGEVARRHRMPPQPAQYTSQHSSPQAQSAATKPRSPRVPVPSYYSPELPPMLQEMLESSDDGREFLASIHSEQADEEEEEEAEAEEAPSRASTPRPDEKHRGFHWDEKIERELLIAAGLNPSPSPDTGERFFSDQATERGREIPAPPLDANILGAAASRTTLEDESGFVTASEGPFTESKEELGEVDEMPEMQDIPDIPDMPSRPGSAVQLPGAFYAQSAAYRSANTLASSMLLPTGVSPRFPFTPTSPPLAVSPNSPRSPQTPGDSDSPADDARRPFPMSRGSSGEAVSRGSPRSPRSSRRTFSYGSRSSSVLLDPPAPLGGLDQIEAQMYKDLYWSPTDDVDPQKVDEQLEAELTEARVAREQERLEREREREEREREIETTLPPSIKVEEDESDFETDEHMHTLPTFSTPPRNAESESEQYLTPAGTASRSRRPSSERAETPMSDYNESFGHGDDDIRVGQVGEMHVPEPTVTRIRHLSVPLSLMESESTEVASALDPSSPNPQRIISLTAPTEGRLSMPSSAFASDFGARHSHLTGVSSNTSGNERMSGLLSDFPQPPEDHPTPSSFTPSSYMQSYYTPVESLDEFPLELRMGESPTVHLATLRSSEMGDSPQTPEAGLR
ncbi:hypothetical protein CALCODRAFT_506543 [Calocera cornea HHB12733]|uniref:Uncharacterized protein n=1 Tax=Calocera cornea HHB12733 TaxID=1353952 RepID=A0A165IS66_9BASI|nr:hypothetical protein CALCODRAFT_506543 [Calocera cornea HHB12733]